MTAAVKEDQKRVSHLDRKKRLVTLEENSKSDCLAGYGFK